MPPNIDTIGHEAPRQVATSRDNDFILSLDEVSQHYAEAGHARTIRTLQRYCASGHLDAQKIATITGDKYLVTPQSVARHIAQIKELQALDNVATHRDQPRHVATPVAPTEPTQTGDVPTPITNDTQRQVATPASDMSRYVGLLERDNEFLREQVEKKDEQISDLSKRFSETQILLGAMQKMLAPMLGQSDPFHAAANSEVRDAQSS